MTNQSTTRIKCQLCNSEVDGDSLLCADCTTDKNPGVECESTADTETVDWLEACQRYYEENATPVRRSF